MVQASIEDLALWITCPNKMRRYGIDVDFRCPEFMQSGV